MSGDILRAALRRLKQEEKFESFQSYLEAEWLSSVEDLSQAAKDEHVWQSLRLPARLKVEMRVLLQNVDEESENSQGKVLQKLNIDRNSKKSDSLAINSDSNINPSLVHTSSFHNDTNVVEKDCAVPAVKSAMSIDIAENDAENVNNCNDVCIKSEEEDEWELYFSEEHQYYYYYNKVTGESQWATEDPQIDPDSVETTDNPTLPPQPQQLQQQHWPPAPPNTCTNSENHSEFVFPKGYSRSESLHRQQVRRHRRDKRYRVQLHRADLADSSSSSSENENDNENQLKKNRCELNRTISRRVIFSDSSSEEDHNIVLNDENSSDEIESNTSEYFIVSEDAAGRKLQVERYQIPRETVRATNDVHVDRDCKAEIFEASVTGIDSVDLNLSAASLLMMSLGEENVEPSAPPLPIAEPLIQLLTPPRPLMSPMSTDSVATQPPTPPTPPLPPPKHMEMRTTRIGKAFNKIFGLSSAGGGNHHNNRRNNDRHRPVHTTNRGLEPSGDVYGESFYDV